MWFIVTAPLLVLLLVLAPAEGQRQDQQPREQEVISDCPLPNGFFADVLQCDRYYECVDNVITEKLCPDGLAFVDKNPRDEKCDYISSVDCTGRPELQPAKPAGPCLRQNGYFYHPDPTVCNKFFFCNGGTANIVTCPTGLVFTNKTNNCVWADLAARTGCAKDGSGGVPIFDCPKVSHDVAVAHPRYPDPDDCQFFYVCIDGINPRRNGCTLGQVFNEVLGTCTPPAETPECAGYYTEYFDEYFRTLESGGRPRGDIIAAAIEAGYSIPTHVLGSNRRSQADGAAGAPARQSFTRRRRPTAGQAAAPAPARAPARASIPVPVPASIPVPALAAEDSFTLSTDFGAPEGADPALDAAPDADLPRRRRPLVSVKRAQRPVEQ